MNDIEKQLEALEKEVANLNKKLDDREADLINAKREERERIIKLLESWRASGKHLMSVETIQALKEL